MAQTTDLETLTAEQIEAHQLCDALKREGARTDDPIIHYYLETEYHTLQLEIEARRHRITDLILGPPKKETIFTKIIRFFQ